MSQFNHAVLLEGRAIPSPTPVRLHAGPVTLLLEPANGFIRQLRVGDHLLLDGVYAAVRDRNWGTITPVIQRLHIDQHPDSFTVVFAAECKAAEIEFFWTGRITGDADGGIRYEFDGEARSDFLRNRIGLCVLHDASCAGLPCVVEHVDGRHTEATFPRSISPHQPFKEIRSVTFALPDGPGVRVRMDGDVFEMEDQRNWTDASFKTYCTPLERPFPVEVKAGERIRQVVEVRLQPGEADKSCDSPTHDQCEVVSEGSSSPALSWGPAGASPYLPAENAHAFHLLPKLGLGMASHDVPMNEVEADLLRRLELDHLRCDLRLNEPGWRECWARAVREATLLGCRLHVALHLTPTLGDEQLQAVAELAERALVNAWLIFVQRTKATPGEWTRKARELLRGDKTNGTPLIIGGTDAYFAELNRNRPETAAADGLNWSINPQVHAFDNLSLLETLDAQWQTALSAREFTTGGLMVSPVTLRRRFNPGATSPPPPPPIDVIPPEVDVRQMSLFGASWTLGSIASLSREPLLRSITYYETTGWRGVMEWSERPRIPHKFITRPDWVYPLYFVFALLAGHDECRPLRVGRLDQTRLLVRRAAEPARVRLLVANHDCEPAGFELPPGFTPDRWLTLDQTNAIAAMREPASLLQHGWHRWQGPEGTLEPYAIAALDGSL